MSIRKGWAFITNNKPPCHDLEAGWQPQRKPITTVWRPHSFRIPSKALRTEKRYQAHSSVHQFSKILVFVWKLFFFLITGSKLCQLFLHHMTDAVCSFVRQYLSDTSVGRTTAAFQCMLGGQRLIKLVILTDFRRISVTSDLSGNTGPNAATRRVITSCFIQ